MTMRNRVFDFVEKEAPFSHMTELNNIVFLSGIIACDDVSADYKCFDSIGSETKTCLLLIQKMLRSVALSMNDVTSVLIHMTDLSEFDEMNKVYETFFKKGLEPTRTCVGVANLLSSARIEITCHAIRQKASALAK